MVRVEGEIDIVGNAGQNMPVSNLLINTEFYSTKNVGKQHTICINLCIMVMNKMQDGSD